MRSSTVKINIFKNSISQANFVKQLIAPLDDGHKSWAIPANFANGNYVIRVKTDDSTCFGDSGVFNVKSKGPVLHIKKPGVGIFSTNIKIHKPSSSSFLDPGEKFFITWDNKLTKGKKVKIDLYNHNGTKFLQTIHTINHVTTPKFRWTIPNIGPKKCKIRISVMGGQGRGWSEKFTIRIKTKIKIYKIYAKTLNKGKYVKDKKGSPLFDFNFVEKPDPGAGKARVGFKNAWTNYKGSYCYLGTIYRSHLFFDVSQFRGKGLILGVKLHYKVYKQDKHGNANCALKSWVINEAWNNLFKVNADFIANTDTQLTLYVQKWVAYPNNNYGMVLTSADESYSHNNNRCIQFAKNIYLEIKLLEKK